MRRLTGRRPRALRLLWVCTALAGPLGCDDGAQPSAAPADGGAPDSVSADGGAADARLDAAPVDAAPGDAGPTDLGPDAAPDPNRPWGTRRFAAPTPWASPLADYLAAGAEAFPDQPFERAVHDLVAFDGRLHLAYGDATLNLGRVVPIEHRAFTDPSDPTALVSEGESREEHLDGFRRFGDRLLLPGIDAVDDAWLGNVYLRALGSPWRMARTVDRGVHVHDAVQWGASLYAVGSGATPEAWGNGNVYAHLWISRDDAATWQVLHTEHNERVGDARFTRLLPLDDALYLFGYRSDAQGSINRLLAGTWDGAAYTPFAPEHPLAGAFITGSMPLSDPTPQAAPEGLVWGADVRAEPLKARAWRVSAGEVTVVDALVGHTLIDLSRVDATGEWLVLTHAGDTWAQTPDPWAATLWVATPSFDGLTEILTLAPAAPLRSVAAWGDALFFGDAAGDVLKAEALP